MEYEMNEINHLDWLNKGPWYNRNICSKLHGINFEDFITQARTDRYNLMCDLVAHDRLQLDYKYDEISIGDRAIPNDATVKTLEALGATFNFIDIWLKFPRESFALEVSHILMLRKRCSCKYLKILNSELLPNKNPKTHDKYWWWMVYVKKC